MKRKPHFLWITDPWETLDLTHDTTLRLAQEAFEMGIQQSWCNVKSIGLHDSQVYLNASAFISLPKDRIQLRLAPSQTRSPQEFSHILYRTDPPVDLDYLHPLQLLALSLRDVKKCETINPLSVLLSANEKIQAARLKDFMPPSQVSSQWECLLKFGQKERKTVLKPLHETQSHGVELLVWKNKEDLEENQKKLRKATLNFTRPVVLQKYLEGITEGEVRLWFLDGKLLGSAKKLPLTGDFRVNIDGGSRLAAYSLNHQERLKITPISRHLRKEGIRLAAIDLIEGWITDFNFTSPGLLTQMEALLKKNLAGPIISALAKPANLGKR